MSDDLHCTSDSCTPANARSEERRSSAPGSSTVLTIDVVSDVICPWCFIGKRRLEKASSLLGNPPGIRVVWKPFQLNPQMPPEGMERRAYRIAKFGSWEKSQALDTQVAANGAKEGITFAFDKMTRTPNTLDAHRLIWLAEQCGVQNAVVEALFRGYFEEGVNLSDRATLVNIATNGGIPAADAERLLTGDEGRAEVLREEDRWKSLGINGVPTFFFNGTLGFSGAAAPEMVADGIRGAMLAERGLRLSGENG